MRQKMTSTMVVAVLLAGAWSEGAGTTAQASPHRGSKVVVSAGVDFGSRIGPSYGRVVVQRSRRPFVYPRRRWPRPVIVERPVVVTRPVYEAIVIAPQPTIRVTIPTPVCTTPVKLTIWVTNSNGSRISVELIREGAYYIGPRGGVLRHDSDQRAIARCLRILTSHAARDIPGGTYPESSGRPTLTMSWTSRFLTHRRRSLYLGASALAASPHGSCAGLLSCFASNSRIMSMGVMTE